MAFLTVAAENCRCKAGGMQKIVFEGAKKPLRNERIHCMTSNREL